MQGYLVSSLINSAYGSGRDEKYRKFSNNTHNRTMMDKGQILTKNLTLAYSSGEIKAR